MEEKQKGMIENSNSGEMRYRLEIFSLILQALLSLFLKIKKKSVKSQPSIHLWRHYVVTVITSSTVVHLSHGIQVLNKKEEIQEDYTESKKEISKVTKSFWMMLV